MLRRLRTLGGVLCATGLVVTAATAETLAAENPTEPRTLFTNVHVFDGVSEKRIENAYVLVEGHLIKAVSTRPIEAGGAAIIDGGGRTLMPGLTDAHWHVLLAAMTGFDQIRIEETDYIHARALKEAGNTLMRGFTTVRDVGGGGFGLKKAIDEGLFPGPRILPSGNWISITGGHGDFTESWRRPRAFGGTQDRYEELEMIRKTAGVPEMLDAVRFNFKRGASQIKLLMGGGVASTYDPLDVNEFTFEEVKAAVDVANNWGTYVAVHIYTPEGIKKAIRAGVKSIEHGHLLDDEIARLMKEKDVWLGIQPFDPALAESPQVKAMPSANQAKFLQVANGFLNSMDLVKKYKLEAQLSYGTDLSFAPQANGIQANMMAKFRKWLSNVEILRMATSQNARMFELSGERHPYREGPLGVIRSGAYADILLVDGNPLQDVSILGDNGKNISLIMKDGKIHKNTLN